jgi:hypothetical protein
VPFDRHAAGNEGVPGPVDWVACCANNAEPGAVRQIDLDDARPLVHCRTGRRSWLPLIDLDRCGYYQVAGGASREQLEQIAEITLRALPC